MKKCYHKLVRDRIPEMIEASGSRCTTEILSEAAYLQKLHEKLAEELQEYLQSGEAEELADLLEVMQAVAKARGIRWEEVEATRQKKKAARGGFEERILLKEVE